jgi:hypothetical protein
MLTRIRNWANQNEGFLALIGLVMMLIGWVARPIASLWDPSSAPVLLGLVARFREVIVGAGLSTLLLAFFLVSMSHRKRLSALEDRLRVLENRPDILLDEATAADLSNWSFGDGQWTSDQDGLTEVLKGVKDRGSKGGDPGSR